MICGLSGGVDSSVAAALVQRAVGDQVTCVFVDHGLLREGEVEQVEQDFVQATGVALKTVDAKQQFLDALAGLTDPEEKRKAIGREFIRVFEQAAREVVDDASSDGHPVRFLVQGTLYPDVVESGGGEGASNIKSHHNVGGLPDDLQFEPGRAAAHAVQGRGARRRPRDRRARGHRVAPAFPRPRPRHPHHRRGHRRAPRHPAPRRRHRPRGASPPPSSTAPSGSAPSCCSPTSAAWACRATTAPTATPSCCAPSPARTP
ncbi:hypothetical protein GCM10025868_33940 [Angustibacter aerolatus]|uniref:Glutamine amidotransferase n=1 Tax=Angustibacter aerolatus TaxID=1162965 RepID=A0ABQ6JLZ5_9ACTN|nr:argininosuccinate synthase [Angustibacter aerolatus]GMA88144.1 hypothetical protein GCM10025868_33940 [Angustibacter aerolatus]